MLLCSFVDDLHPLFLKRVSSLFENCYGILIEV